MKTLFTMLAIVITCYGSYAQNTFPWPSVGNVGIGTASPLAKLDVYTPSGANVLLVRSGSGAISQLTAEGNQFGWVGTQTNHDFYVGANNNGRVKILAGGDVVVNQLYVKLNAGIGIGTTNPSGLLDILRPATNGIITRWGTLFDAGQALDIKAIQSSSSNGYYSLDLSASTGGWQKLIIPIGNVGIGTTNPDAKLAVNGTIHSKEVKVDLGIPAPDYVFEPDYKLATLNEIGEYVKKSHHLPEIPSADQMAKEGINLSEMNMKLLKKVEELTLYLIEQQKVNQSLQDQINKLTSK